MTSARDFARGVNPHYVTGRQLAMYARNTGRFYRRHLEIARFVPTLEKPVALDLVWCDHVSGVVVPEYKRECDREATIPELEIVLCARELRDYYEQHVLEGA